ncbi:MAG: DUF4331 family protein [Acidobacteriota bacterium]
MIGLGVGTLLVLHAPTHAADHLDAPAIMTNPMADITDVYAWMSSDAKLVNLVMDVSPGDPGTMGSGAMAPRHFGPSILYVFHVSSVDGYPPKTATETKVICRFNSDTDAECWVGDKDYVHGNPTVAGGIVSASTKVRLFAGRRSDPFFFNFNGFADAVATVDAAEAGAAGSGLKNLDTDGDGCPDALPGAEGSALRSQLQEGPTGVNAHPPCNGTDQDCFLHFDVQSIVLQIDKTLLNTGSHSILGVWASTHST